jgi:hypothetical protein
MVNQGPAFAGRKMTSKCGAMLSPLLYLTTANHESACNTDANTDNIERPPVYPQLKILPVLTTLKSQQTQLH